jgi:hypothetical protein
LDFIRAIEVDRCSNVHVTLFRTKKKKLNRSLQIDNRTCSGLPRIREGKWTRESSLKPQSYFSAKSMKPNAALPFTLSAFCFPHLITESPPVFFLVQT